MLNKKVITMVKQASNNETVVKVTKPAPVSIFDAVVLPANIKPIRVSQYLYHKPDSAKVTNGGLWVVIGEKIERSGKPFMYNGKSIVRVEHWVGAVQKSLYLIFAVNGASEKQIVDAYAVPAANVRAMPEFATCEYVQVTNYARYSGGNIGAIVADVKPKPTNA